MKLASIFALLLLIGCAPIMQVGQTEQANKSYLDAALLSYEIGDRTYYWIPEAKQGLLGLSTPEGIPGTRQVIVIKDGQIERVIKLGKNRALWCLVLKTQLGWSQETIIAIIDKQIFEGMTLDQVLICWGYPRWEPPYNYRATKYREDIEQDGKLYYPYWGHILITLEDGKVASWIKVKPSKSWEWDNFKAR